MHVITSRDGGNNMLSVVTARERLADLLSLIRLLPKDLI